MPVEYDRSGLIALIKSEFKIDWHGIHGSNHWARVDDGRDPKHGERAAEFAHGIHGDYFQLEARQLDKLCYAMHNHSGGLMSDDATIQTCWDSDRLDLGRVGIMPSTKYLSDQASIFIDLAYDWSRSSV